MDPRKRYLALDIGVSSGRVMAAGFDGKKLGLEEIYRFGNKPVDLNGTQFTDILRIYQESLEGILKAANSFDDIISMGIDTWGVDFALLDRDGSLISNPICHRDKRLSGIMERVFQEIDKKQIYFRTGVHFQKTNSLYQLYAMRQLNPGFLERTAYFLMLGDLLNYFFTGGISCEYTGATTTQLYNLEQDSWEGYLLDRLHLDREIFMDPVYAGTSTGVLRSGLPGTKTLKVIRSAYDTSSEISAIPVTQDVYNKNWAFLCAGTTGTIGMVSQMPVINDKGFEYEFGNEGGLEGTFNF